MNKNHFCHIYLVRHGETDSNKSGYIQSITDNPLNETGVLQCKVLNKQFQDIEFSAAYCSNLSRTRTTAELILAPRNLHIEVTPSINECYAGKWEGTPIKEFLNMIKQNRPPAHITTREDYMSHKHDPDLESLMSIYRRVEKFILGIAPSHYNQKILMCSHGGVILSFLNYFKFVYGREWHIPNGAFLELKANADSISLIRYEGIKFD
jgi:broad specificity phosphatase PhoE